eukprot:scaffold101967_cov25-Tisochrysis_lutea.AAC.1
MAAASIPRAQPHERNRADVADAPRPNHKVGEGGRGFDRLSPAANEHDSKGTLTLSPSFSSLSL